MDRIAQSVEYIGTLDTTLSGSRNALTPLFLWYAFHTIGISGFKTIIQNCLKVADYAVEQLNQLARNAWHHTYSNTVVFDRPSPSVTQHWQLACHGPLSHLITMPHVTTTQVDQLVTDIKAAETVTVDSREELATARPVIEGSNQEIILVGSADTKNLLTNVSSALAAAQLSIEEVTAVKVEEGSVVRLRVNDHARALKILNQTLDIGRNYGQSQPLGTDAAADILSQVDYQAVSGDALLVQLEDKPGSLASIMKRCRDQNVPIRSVRLLWRGKYKAVVELASPEPVRLKSLLTDQVFIH